jgi:hypothetical protein
MAKRASSRSAKSAAQAGENTPSKVEAPAAPASRGRGRSRGPSRGLGYVAGAAKGKSPGHRRVAQPRPRPSISTSGATMSCSPASATSATCRARTPRASRARCRGWISSTTSARPMRFSRARRRSSRPEAGRQGNAGIRRQVWFATDLDREGEAIAWHLAQELGRSPAQGQAGDVRRHHQGRDREGVRQPAPDRRGPRQRAAGAPDPRPHRGVPGVALLWKKVARGLSAGARAVRRRAAGRRARA